MGDNRYIAVEGVIGVGKSSLARMLAERLQARTVFEEVEENPFLKDFYRDRAAHAFQTQMHFLFARYQQQRSLAQTELFSERTVADYIFQKDRIFASLNLSERELVLYEKMIGLLEMDVMKPDVVVYLQANTDTLVERIGRRGRPYERDIDRGYLHALNDAYNHYFFHYVDSPLLVVSTNSIDFVKRPEDFEDLNRRILTHRQGTVYYQPLDREETP